MNTRPREYEPPEVSEYGTVEEITRDKGCGHAEDEVGYERIVGSVVPDHSCG